MSAIDQPAEVVATRARAKTQRVRTRPRGDMWWRHLIALTAVVFALFPILYIAASAFNAEQTLSASSLFPRHFTLDNFRDILSGEVVGAGGNTLPVPYLRWYANSLIVGSVAAFSTVLLGAFAAYAFSRFRFKGRRIGMMTLLLIQMFPQFLALVAIYLILDATGDVFSVLGLNTLTGLLVVYLAGAMGVNAWLMKGFFDTIPAELDESARVDGATPAQVFWGVVLPLAAPVLAVVALLSFIGTINDFVIASALMQTQDKFTLPVGMRFFVDQKYAEQWGPFCAGVLLAAVPVVVLFAFLQRFIVGGLTGGAVKG
jgi:arabinogalactan oligomer / maltooligosaccharide transport system permease protein